MFLGEDEFAFLKSIPCFDGFFVGEFYLVFDFGVEGACWYAHAVCEFFFVAH